jgi:tetratricopeptide (TPR) repeat protein
MKKKKKTAAKPRARRKYAERAERLSRARSPTRRPSPFELRALQAAEYADACRFAGRIEESERVFSELLSDASAKQNRMLACIARTGLGNAFASRSRWEEAERVLRPALDDARAVRDPMLRARVQCVLASSLFNRGEVEESKRLLTEGLRTAREYEALPIQVAALTSLGIVSLAKDDLPAAFTFLSQGVGLAERTSNDHWAVIGRSYLAIQAHLSGRTAAAREMYELSLSELESLGIRRALGVCRFACATLYQLLGDWERSCVMLEQAMSELAVTCPDYEPLLVAALALSDLGAGKRGALQRLAHARSLCEAESEPRFVDIVQRIEEIDTAGRARTKTAKTKTARSIEALLVERVCERLESRGSAGVLVLDEDASTYRVSGGGQRVDLSRRVPLQRLLQELSAAHAREPGSFITDDELVRRVWPDERIHARAARIRLHTTVSMLRGKGLGAWVERFRQGYRLRPEVTLKWVGRDAPELADDEI